MKYILIIIAFFSINSNSQTTNFGDKINGMPKEYKETFFEAKKINNKYVKGKYLYDDTFVININNEYVKQTMFPLEKWETPQYKYNDNNLKIEIINYYETGEIINRTKFKYNSENKIIEEQFYYASDTLISNSVYEYNNNLLTKKIEKIYNYDVENSIQINNTTYKYDLKENLISELYNSDFQELLYTYKYNKDNYLTEVYWKDSLTPKDKELKISKKNQYIKYDKFNWTETFFEDYSGNGKSKIYYIERIYKY